MRKLFYLGLIALTGIIIGFAWAEQITLTTYYPAPYGVYREFTTTGNTYLATQEGSVGIGTTSPASKLHVRGHVELGDGSGVDPLLVELYDGFTTSYPIIQCLENGTIFLRPYPAPPGNFDLQAYNSQGVAYNLIRLQNSTTTAIPNLQLQPDGGNVGIGTASPTTPAPNNQAGNLDVNDIYLRSSGQWVSGGGFDPASYTGGESVTFPNGLIMKMGYRAFSGNTAAITFETQFPNAIRSAVGTPAHTTFGDWENITLTGLSTTGITFRQEQSIHTGIYWFAIGY